MRKLNKIIGIVFDFFFPKDKRDKEIEKITAEILSNKLVRNNKTEHSYIYVLFDYKDDVIRNMIWSLKYRNNKYVANVFSQILYDFLIEEFSDLVVYSNFEKPVIIPIPMHKRHLYERGFNQTEILAKELYKIGGDSFCQFDFNVLKKIKNIKSQTTLHKSKRLKNVIGAFKIKHPEKIKGRCVVLLDDVITTGATLKEARKVLTEAGAKKVIGVAIAH